MLNLIIAVILFIIGFIIRGYFYYHPYDYIGVPWWQQPIGWDIKYNKYFRWVSYLITITGFCFLYFEYQVLAIIIFWPWFFYRIWIYYRTKERNNAIEEIFYDNKNSNSNQ